MSYLQLGRVVRSVDSLLRQRQGIRDFTDDAECLFRISLARLPGNLSLSDGTAIGEGDPVIELHLWNEHLPAMPDAGPSPAWAVRLARQTAKSLFLLDHYLEREPALDEVAGLFGLPPFGSRIGEVQMARTGKRFGFELLDGGQDGTVHMVFDSMLLWGLGWTFNRPALRSKTWLRHRYRLWISRAGLHARYHDWRPGPASNRH